MKKISKIASVLILLVTLFSCEKEEFGPVVGVYTPPQLADVSGNYIFTEAKAADVFKTFTWSKADFGFPSATNYTLQIAPAGKNFEGALDLVTTNQTSFSITIGALNQKLLAMGTKTNVASSFEVRVNASVNEKVQTLSSNVPVMSILPYKVVIIYPSLYLPGNYQAASGYTSDWSPDKAQKIYSVKQNKKYEGYVNMVGSGIKYKYTDGPNWDVNYGDDGANGSLEKNGADIAIPSAGYYRIKADLNALTYSFMKTDWGVIGDATPTGWDSDTNMTYSMATKTWTVTLNLKAGKIKFRANDAWDLNYGDNGFDGTLEEGGADIPVDQAGNYTITLNLEVAGYEYSVKKN